MLSFRRAVILILAVGAGAGVLCAGGLNANEDWQAWYHVAGAAQSGPWQLRVEDEIRTGNDGHNFYYNHLEAGVSRAAAAWLELGLSFRQSEQRQDGAWEHENRPYGDATLKWPWLACAFKDRHRLEYRDLEDAPDRWRYRNKLTVYPPLTLLADRLQPYVAEEVYLDLTGGYFDRNRVYLGVACRLLAWLQGECYYLWQAQHQSPDWLNTNVIGLKLAARF